MPRVRRTAAQNQRRQKLIALVGGLILVALLVLQGPKMLNRVRGEASATPPAATAPEPAAAPDPSGQPATSVPPSASQAASTAARLLDTDPPPHASEGQLVRFHIFSSKDPFAQQLDAGPQVQPTARQTGTSASSSSTPKRRTRATGRGAAPTTARPGRVSRQAPKLATSAVISTNGTVERLSVGALFPQQTPAFRLLSITSIAVKIAVAGGSFAQGVPSTTLRKGVPLTLANTATGEQFELRLLSVS
jgi:hypothetical protein